MLIRVVLVKEDNPLEPQNHLKEKMNKMNEKRLYIVIGKMWDKFGKGVKLS